MDLADHIFSKRETSAEPEWIADILTRLLWLTADNGHEICNTLKRWLTEDQLLKAQIALQVGEVFLWDSAVEMESILSRIERNFPALAELCASNRAKWHKQFPAR
jgi:hypothetical protein